MSPEAEVSPTPAPRYARFSRRVRGVMLDWVITLIIIFGAVLVATTVGNNNVSRALGILVVIALLLYEPVLVSFTGGTLGHYFSNLRVVLTGSTVQIRDPAKALPYQYITERTEFSDSNMPSRWRRLAIICCYLLLIFAIYLGVLAGIMAMGVLSPRCISNNFCSSSERLVRIAVPILLLAASALCIGLGWRGKLFGARKTS